MRRPWHIALAAVMIACASTVDAQEGAGGSLGQMFRFSDIDENRDGWVIRSEWILSSADFKRLDSNFDNMISPADFEHDAACADRDALAEFNLRDANGDGWLSHLESQLPTGEFNRLDRNRDKRLNRLEFEYTGAKGGAYIGPRSQSWRAGYQRGVQEGLVAGREDYISSRGWDLEGQKALEQADSGYTPDVGMLGDYQGGYLDGFEAAYRVGYFNARNGR